MKKSTPKKLALETQTIRALTPDQLAGVVGGTVYYYAYNYNYGAASAYYTVGPKPPGPGPTGTTY